MTVVLREFLLAVGNSLPASLIAKSTVVAVLGLMVAWLARRGRAAACHVVLAAMFGVLLLLPVASVVMRPIRIAVPTLGPGDMAPTPRPGDLKSIPIVSLPYSHPRVTVPMSRSSRLSPSAILMAAWIIGAALSLIPMVVGLWQIRSLRRSGLSWKDGQAIAGRLVLETGMHRRVEVLLQPKLTGPIACGLWHPAILLPADARTWGSDDLTRALVHELEHVRRGDFVSHCLARAVCSMYWFHPLVWMAWRQLALAAERSCDDAVLARSEATAYADQLVGLARRLSTAAKAPMLTMASSAALAIRARAVLENRQRRGPAGRFPLTVGWAAAAVIVFTMSPLRTISVSQSGSAQFAAKRSPDIAAGTPLPSYWNVSIKPCPPGEAGPSWGAEPGKPMNFECVTVVDLIGWGYNIRSFQVIGGEGWIQSERYHIDATPPWNEFRGLSNAQINEKLAQGIQSLLADRFKLVLHRETRQLPRYVLSIAKNGAKLKEAKPGDEYAHGPRGPDGHQMPGFMLWNPGEIIGEGVPISSLVQMLEEELTSPVADQTGLKGPYHIAFKWSPDQTQAAFIARIDEGRKRRGMPPWPLATTSSGPSIFPAIEEQVGLKLEQGTGPVEILVIDHVEKPLEN